MCVAALAWNAHPRWRLVVAANRDEYHERPTAPLAHWGHGVIAGQDLRAGGTWLGAGAQGRFALVTNHRVEGYPRPELATRGALVTDWLEQGALPANMAAMNPFNLLCIGMEGALFASNWPHEQVRTLQPGIHGVSNGPFDQPWPKARRLCAALDEWLELDSGDSEPLFAALHDETARQPVEPGKTDPEPRLSGVFIRDPLYGTRCSTVVMVGSDGAGTIIERRFDSRGAQSGETALAFTAPAA